MKKIETIEMAANKFHALMRDARRYHWIRSKVRIETHYDDDFYQLPPIMKQPFNQSFNHQTFDEAIDTAMKDKKCDQ